MLLINPSIPSSSSTTSTPSNATPSSPLTTINDSWMNVFNDRPTTKPTFALSIDPTIALGNTTNVSTPLPGFVLLQHIYAQRAEIIPIYYQLTAFLFRQMPSDDMMEQTEVSKRLFLSRLSLPERRRHPLLLTFDKIVTLSSVNYWGHEKRIKFEITNIVYFP